MTSEEATDFADGLASLAPRTVLADEVHTRLRGLIMDSSISPRTRINIEDVARRLDVSPTPVREALARLESDGLVEKLPLKGYRTTDTLSPLELQELYELRLMLEPPTAARAADRIDPAILRALSQELESGRDSQLSTQENYAALSAHDMRFHDLIFVAANNETIRQAYTRMHCHLHTFRLGYHGSKGSNTIAEHEAIAAAILAGDATAAKKAMTRHIENSRDRAVRRLTFGRD